MAIPNKQIGWSNEANLLWLIAKQTEQLTRVISTHGGGGGGGVISVNGQTGVVILTSSDIPSIASTYVPYTGANADVNIGTFAFIGGYIYTSLGTDDGIDNFTNLYTNPTDFHFYGRSGSDFDNLGYAGIDSSPASGNSLRWGNSDGSKLINVTYFNSVSQNLVESDDSNGQIRNRVIDTNASTGSEINQTSTTFKVLDNTLYTSSGLLGVDFDGKTAYIGDNDGANNGTRIFVDDVSKTISLQADNGATLNGENLITQGVDNNTTVVLSAATLNATYPNAKPNFVVWCKLITLGALRYEKTEDGVWVSIPIIIVT